jgi:lysophospholipase L1-like esterase
MGVVGTRRAWLLALAAGGLLVAGRSGWLLRQSATLVGRSQPFQASPGTPGQRLLVVGDSTAVGTGASSAAHSLVGLIGADHPGWRIHNLAANGARFADVLQQLRTAGDGWDRVLVLAGGNDVIRLTPADALRADISQVLALARQTGRRVVLMPAGSVGHAPFFWPPLSWWMDARSRMLHALVQPLAQQAGAVYVRLLQPRAQDPFVQQAALLHAADGLHPSDAGYRLWYAALRQQGGLDG